MPGPASHLRDLTGRATPQTAIPPAHKGSQDVTFANPQGYPTCPYCGIAIPPGEPMLCIQEILGIERRSP